MKTAVELNMDIFPCLGAILLLISTGFVTELSIKTGIFLSFEKTSFFENRKAMLTKRYFLITMILSSWSLSYLSLWYYLGELIDKDFVQESLKHFLMGTFGFLFYFYFAASYWRKKPSQFEQDVEHLGSNR